MMPRDTNPHGTIFGGVLLGHIDLAGAAGAQHYVSCAGWPDQPMVTISLEKVEFLHPVFIGDIVSFWTRVLRVGRTSITMHVSVEADRQGREEPLTEAQITYVSIDDQRRPVPLRGPEAD
ncbi:MAG: acyl-CoA thioesterase [Candidatus Latescibacteria bacterium]|nr:acyl-CoA thioesterase [Candidatus Latescibacterota bacterium]